MMTFDEMEKAVNEARITMERAKLMVKRMAPMIAGSLESGDVDHRTL